ncbi:MAG: ATP-binding cassette domain-containing protein [Syntrophomonadaceae bacterium]|nr:ATP-binding cassette domain-containing protein [Syntrophomonadaceae bacterium]
MATLTLQSLSFSYPQAETPALRDISLHVPSGEWVTVAGASGSGKSTLLRHLKPALTPHGDRAGDILLDGQPLAQLDRRSQAARVGFVMQNPEQQPVTDKVWHELAFGLESLGEKNETIRARVAEMASFFGLQHWFHQPVNQLSGGQKQLLNLAAVMTMQPEILILDEPTARLDPIAAADFLEMVAKAHRELGLTVIMSEHRLDEVLPRSDRLIVLQQGAVIADAAPAQAARELFAMRHPLFTALPAPARIAARCGCDGDYPLTVRAGRDWLDGQHPRPLPPDPAPPPPGNAIIRAEEVWFRYQREAPDVLKSLSLDIYEGEILALMGGNATGKSTLLTLLGGLQKPYRGRVTGSRDTAIMPQNPQTLFVRATVREELAAMVKGSAAETDAAVMAAAERCALTPLLKRHPYDLSGGEQQRLALALVMLTGRRILLLDEPTKGLDSYAKAQLADIFKGLQTDGYTIVIVSHDIEFCAGLAQRCALLFDGGITAAGPVRQFLAGNRFYTTAANRMARRHLPQAITVDDVVAACGGEDFTPDDHTRHGNPNAGPAVDEVKPAATAATPATAPRSGPRSKITAALLSSLPLTVLFGLYVLDDRSYYFTSLLLITEILLLGFLALERRRPRAREVVLIAVLCALTVATRAAFFMVPQFKPALAIVILSGVCFGPRTGLLTGALSMFVSGFFFGQGPWTPWQMLAFGLIGALAGGLFQPGRIPQQKAALCLFGAFTALIVYGGIMNPAAVLIMQPFPTIEMFIASWLAGVPFDLLHAASTALFLLLLANPLLAKMERVRIKYGLPQH